MPVFLVLSQVVPPPVSAFLSPPTLLNNLPLSTFDVNLLKLLLRLRGPRFSSLLLPIPTVKLPLFLLPLLLPRLVFYPSQLLGSLRPLRLSFPGPLRLSLRLELPTYSLLLLLLPFVL